MRFLIYSAIRAILKRSSSSSASAVTSPNGGVIINSSSSDCCIRRMSSAAASGSSSGDSIVSEMISRARALEWMRNDESALSAALSRARFLVFIERHPLMKKPINGGTAEICADPHGSTTVGSGGGGQTEVMTPLWISYEQLMNITENYGVGEETVRQNMCLLDLIPAGSSAGSSGQKVMTSSSKESVLSDLWVPLMAYGLNISHLSKSFDSHTPSATLQQEIASKLGGTPVDLRVAMVMLRNVESVKLLTRAQSTIQWTNSFKHCPKCSQRLKYKFSKSVASCQFCSKTYFPYLFPVVICLISDPSYQHLLLVRQPRHPKGIYTAVAGFVNAGESLEEAVCREVVEEVGLEPTEIKYLSLSHHWPYPQSSLMIAFHATIPLNQRPNIDPSELEDADWFSRSMVECAFENVRKDPQYTGHYLQECSTKLWYVPPRSTAAYRMIKLWLASQSAVPMT